MRPYESKAGMVRMRERVVMITWVAQHPLRIEPFPSGLSRLGRLHPRVPVMTGRRTHGGQGHADRPNTQRTADCSDTGAARDSIGSRSTSALHCEGRS
jgi:hypothetical protein